MLFVITLFLFAKNTLHMMETCFQCQFLLVYIVKGKILQVLFDYNAYTKAKIYFCTSNIDCSL